MAAMVSSPQHHQDARSTASVSVQCNADLIAADNKFNAARSPEISFGTSHPEDSDLSIRIPKNKSTGNLLAVREVVSAGPERLRFSFDAGSSQDVKNLKR